MSWRQAFWGWDGLLPTAIDQVSLDMTSWQMLGWVDNDLRQLTR
jgi:hypothetical protein